MESKISIILPAYNEKGNITALIDAIHSELGSRDHEIIVIDDNSQDGTPQAVSALNDPSVKIVLRHEIRSLGKSVQDGIDNASGDILVIMDSDFQHHPKYLPKMIDALKDYDSVFASRFIPGGGMNSRSRYLLSLLFNYYVRLMTSGKISDNLYGYFSIKRNVIKEIKDKDIFRGYGDYCIRLLYYLQRNKINILEIPAQHGQRLTGRGNAQWIKTFFQYFWAVIELFFKRIRAQ